MSNLLTIVTNAIIAAAAALSLTACGSPEINDVVQEDTFATWREPLYTAAKQSYTKAGLDTLIVPAVSGCYVDGIIGWLKANNCPNVVWGSTNKAEEVALSQCLAKGFNKAAAVIGDGCVAKFAGQRDSSN